MKHAISGSRISGRPLWTHLGYNNLAVLAAKNNYIQSRRENMHSIGVKEYLYLQVSSCLFSLDLMDLGKADI